MAARHCVERFQFSSPSSAPLGEVMAGAPGGRPDTRFARIGISRCGTGIERRPAALGVALNDREAPHGLVDSNAGGGGTGVLAVAAVTLANGGDNIGLYVPVFTTTSVAGLLTYTAVFLVLVAVWCLAGHFFARRPLIARALSRWGHILLPVVLISIGLIILIEGHAFSL